MMMIRRKMTKTMINFGHMTDVLENERQPQTLYGMVNIFAKVSSVVPFRNYIFKTTR